MANEDRVAGKNFDVYYQASDGTYQQARYNDNKKGFETTDKEPKDLKLEQLYFRDNSPTEPEHYNLIKNFMKIGLISVPPEMNVSASDAKSIVGREEEMTGAQINDITTNNRAASKAAGEDIVRKLGEEKDPSKENTGDDHFSPVEKITLEDLSNKKAALELIKEVRDGFYNNKVTGATVKEGEPDITVDEIGNLAVQPKYTMIKPNEEMLKDVVQNAIEKVKSR